MEIDREVKLDQIIFNVHFTRLSFRPFGEVYRKYSIECNTSVTILFHILLKLAD